LGGLGELEEEGGVKIRDGEELEWEGGVLKIRDGKLSECWGGGNF